jgi:hypothetical protein
MLIVIDSNAIQITILDGLRPNDMLVQWASQAGSLHFASRIGTAFPSMAAFRNRIVMDFLRGPMDYLLMLDHDIVPIGDADRLLTEEGDLIGCRYIDRRGMMAHPCVGSLPAGAMRIHRSVFAAIPAPWFGNELDNISGEVKTCECAWFCEKAVKAGIVPQSVGIIGHAVRTVVLPQHDSPSAPLTFRFLKEMETACAYRI